MTTLTTTTATTTATATASKGKKPYKSWLKDGVNGGMSSMDILVHWLADNQNYSKWRGRDNCTERTPKKVLLEEIIERMRQVGIYHRLPKDVASKISTLQSNYRTTREWHDTEGKKLRQAGVKEEIVHEEIVKRFPYWDALHGSFGNFRTSPSWPMSISSIMDREEEEEALAEKNNQPQCRYFRPQLHQHHTSPTHTTTTTIYQHSPPHPHHFENLDTNKLMNTNNSFLLPPLTSASSSSTNSSSHSYFHRDEIEEESSSFPVSERTTSLFSTHNNTSGQSMTPTGRRRRRMSDSHLIHLLHSMKQPRLNDTISETALTEPTKTPPPMTTTLHEKEDDHEEEEEEQDNTLDKRYESTDELTESLLNVTQEKEAGKMEQSQDNMLEFLHEKRMEREQLLVEQERTRRIRAKADLVKNLMAAGFTKQEIAEQLQFI